MKRIEAKQVDPSKKWVKEYNKFKSEFDWDECKTMEEVDITIINWMIDKLNELEEMI